MILNRNFQFLEENAPTTRVIALQGGTRSGKTYSTLQYIIKLCFKYKGMRISVVRKTLPALKASALKDFIEILEGLGIYSESNHNKSQNEYNLNGNLIEFFSVDNAEKLRGRKRNLLFCNEVTEIDQEDWRQLLFRTTGRIIVDYNPSFFEHWVYDNVLTREDCKLLITTYRDNPFLSKDIINEIERLKEIDPEYYKVFGMGERGQLKDLIFQFNTSTIPSDLKPICLALDYGFTNDPTAVIECYKQGDSLYFNEVIYERGLTNQDIAQRLKHYGRIEIVSESAEPKSNEELRRQGLFINEVGKKDTLLSIDILKRFKIHITPQSTNFRKEMQTYKWITDKHGTTLNKPLDYNNHCIDAMRYFALNKLSYSVQNSGVTFGL